jgi:hypothetical protein
MSGGRALVSLRDELDKQLEPLEEAVQRAANYPETCRRYLDQGNCSVVRLL